MHAGFSLHAGEEHEPLPTVFYYLLWSVKQIRSGLLACVVFKHAAGITADTKRRSGDRTEADTCIVRKITFTDNYMPGAYPQGGGGLGGSSTPSDLGIVFAVGSGSDPRGILNFEIGTPFGPVLATPLHASRTFSCTECIQVTEIRLP